MKTSADWQNLQTAAQQELARRNPNSLLDWSLAYRFFQGKPMRLIPALQDLYQDTHPTIIVQKAAQVFISEHLINPALWPALPEPPLDKAMEESQSLSDRLSPPPPKKSGAARLRLKRIGQGHLYLRGSDSRRQLSSVDADVVLLDEFDLMAEGVLELAQKRLASSALGWLRVASTPRLPEAGVNALFLQSDHRYYFLKCSACGLAPRLRWEHHVAQ